MTLPCKAASVTLSRKRRKLSNDCDDTNDKMLNSSIDSSESSHNVTSHDKNESINNGKCKHAKLDKLPSLGRHATESGVDLIAIKEMVHAFVSNPATCERIIARVDMDSKGRA